MSSLRQLGAQAPPHDAAALARRILSEPRFRVRVQAPPAHTWWDTLRQWVADRWNQLLDVFARHVHVGKEVSLATGDVLIGAAIIVFIVFAVRLLLGVVRDGAAAQSENAHALPVHADPRELQAAAQRAAHEGAYAAAVALLFRAALSTLDARGVLRDDPARTVNECRADVRAHAFALSAAFDTIARGFTAAVYAEDRVSHAQWNDAEAAYAALTAAQGNAA
ncbi:MAG TPA: DUF4129 domain-containing protein [Candidatus Baltobacteraceae bacterium]|nr:DUF4129 domain-containing protein [Candidatus Baltobacteraceae bacterium]